MWDGYTNFFPVFSFDRSHSKCALEAIFVRIVIYYFNHFSLNNYFEVVTVVNFYIPPHTTCHV